MLIAICISSSILVSSSCYKSLIIMSICSGLILFLGASLLVWGLNFAISSLLELILVVIVQLIENVVVQVFGFCSR